MALKSDNVEFVRYCGGHFENGDQSGINSGHHYLPTYQILMISDNAELSLCQILCLYHYPFNVRN